MRYILVVCFIILPFKVCAQNEKMPQWFNVFFNEHKLNDKYSFANYLKPVFLTSDLNGDGMADIAVLITEKATGKKGIAIVHQNGRCYIFGAGNKFGNGGSNFKWACGWRLYKKKMAYEMLFDNDGGMTGSKKIKLNKPGIFVYDLEDGQPNSGGIIYWNGNKYIWIHQGE